MGQNNEKTGGAAGLLWEIPIAGTVASALLTKLNCSNEQYFSSLFFGWAMGFNHSFGRGHGDELGVNLAFVTFAVALTAIIVVLLRLGSRSAAPEKVTRRVAGVLAVGSPAACLWLVYDYRTDWLAPNWALLLSETSIAMACAVLIACDLWPVSSLSTTVLLVLHGAIWYAAYSSAFELAAICWRTAPITALLGSLMWVYVVRYRRPRARAALAGAPEIGE